jgi:outer membrane protein TolC
VSDAIGARTGAAAVAQDDGDEPIDPTTLVDLSDGLDENEVVLLALAYSPAFRIDMNRLELAQIALDDARRPDNPRLSVGGPIGNIAGAVGLVAPLMSLFRIPGRTREASTMLEAVAESLVSSGLATAGDVRIAHVELARARRRAVVQAEVSALSDERAALVALRVSAGESSRGELLVAQAASSREHVAAGAAQRDVAIAEARLRSLTGLQDVEQELVPIESRALPAAPPALDDLLAVARESRPDVLSARLEIEAAGTRMGLTRAAVYDVALLADYQWHGSAQGVRLGGAMTLPVFNQNQAQRGRATTELETALIRLELVRQRTTLEIVTANAGLAQALSSLQMFETSVLPTLDAGVEAASARERSGETSRFDSLDAAIARVSARMEHVGLVADAHRALAQLEQAVGARLELASTEPGDLP